MTHSRCIHLERCDERQPLRGDASGKNITAFMSHISMYALLCLSTFEHTIVHSHSHVNGAGSEPHSQTERSASGSRSLRPSMSISRSAYSLAVGPLPRTLHEYSTVSIVFRNMQNHGSLVLFAVLVMGCVVREIVASAAIDTAAGKHFQSNMNAFCCQQTAGWFVHLDLWRADCWRDAIAKEMRGHELQINRRVRVYRLTVAGFFVR